MEKNNGLKSGAALAIIGSRDPFMQAALDSVNDAMQQIITDMADDMIHGPEIAKAMRAERTRIKNINEENDKLIAEFLEGKDNE